MSKIRVIHKSPVLNDLGVILSVVELAGPSSETKPTTGFANGSLFLETDTGKIFIFDEDDGWSEVETGGGGGGGSGLPDTPSTDGTYALQNTVESGTGTLSWASGGGGGVLLVTLTYNENDGTSVCDKTAIEIWNGALNGVVMFKRIDSHTVLFALQGALKNNSDMYQFTLPSGEYLEASSDSDYPSGYVS